MSGRSEISPRTLFWLTAAFILTPWLLRASGTPSVAFVPSLAPCPATSNCVSSQASDREHKVDPIPFSGDPALALSALEAALLKEPRTRIVSRSEDEIRAECTSFVFGFIDDLHVAVDRDARVLHLRSASRTGSYDFGVNRRRVERLRQRFQVRR